MSKAPLRYILTPSSVTDSMTYLKFLEQLILASLFRSLETHESVLPSCCPFQNSHASLVSSSQRDDKQLKVQTLWLLWAFYSSVINSDLIGVLLFCVLLDRVPISHFPLLGLRLFFSLQEPEDHWAAWLVVCASSLIEAQKIFLCAEDS